MVSDAAVANIDNAAAIARLAAYSRVHTTDVDEAAEAIGRITFKAYFDLFANPTFHTTGTYTITGGTGRFSTATGSGSNISDVDFPNGLFNPGTFTFSQNGTINY